MPKRCAICIHDKRCEIERDIIKGVPYSTISHLYGVKEQCIKDHRAAGHLSAEATKKRGDDMAALLEECLAISLGAAGEARAAKCYSAVGSIMAGPYKVLERVPTGDEESGLQAMRAELKERRNVEAATPGQ